MGLWSRSRRNTGGTPVSLSITLIEKFPTVNGTLHDEKGNLSPTGTAIIFPEEPALLDSALNTVRIARADQLGVFSLRAVRPGSRLVRSCRVRGVRIRLQHQRAGTALAEDEVA